MITIYDWIFGLLFLFALIGVIAICFIVVFIFKSIKKDDKEDRL